jgi:uncharacterized protein involved in exopolysaccharide biosynthesis
MENSFDLLEQRVRKAAELVRRLRKENGSLEESLATARGRVQEAEKRLSALEKERTHASKDSRDREGLESEVKTLRKQRDEVRQRIARLVEVLDSLDDAADEG